MKPDVRKLDAIAQPFVDVIFVLKHGQDSVPFKLSTYWLVIKILVIIFFIPVVSIVKVVYFKAV